MANGLNILTSGYNVTLTSVNSCYNSIINYSDIFVCR